MTCEWCRAKIRRSDRICPSCGYLRPVTRLPLRALGIIGGVLACFVAIPLAGGFVYARQMRQSQRTAVRFELMAIHAVASRWASANPGECPTTARLRAEKELSSGSRQTDPWGSDFRITCDGSTLTVITDGPDRLPDTPDDVRASSSDSSVR